MAIKVKSSYMNTEGITTQFTRAPGDHAVPTSGRHVEVFDDFHYSGKWESVLSAGCTLVGTAGTGVAITHDGNADGDDALIRGNCFWTPTQGKNFVWEARVKVALITDEYFFGMATHVVTGDAVAIANANCMGFQLDGDANLEAVVTSGTTPDDDDTTIDVVADTFYILRFEYDGDAHVLRSYVDGVLKNTVTSPALPVVPLAPVFGARATGSHACTLTVDYVYYKGEL